MILIILLRIDFIKIGSMGSSYNFINILHENRLEPRP